MLTWPDAAVVIVAMLVLVWTAEKLIAIVILAIRPTQAQARQESDTPQETDELTERMLAPEPTLPGFRQWSIDAHRWWAKRGIQLKTMVTPASDSPSANPDGGSQATTTE